MTEQIKEKDVKVKALIFFSVDIVDSAAYKSRFINEWSRVFMKFFRIFPAILNERCKGFQIPRHEDFPIDLPHPKIWKLVGDEILFFIDICESFNQLRDKYNKKLKLDYYELVVYYTILFRRLIIDLNKERKKKKDKEKDREQIKHCPAFKIKGAAWFANVVEGPNYDHRYGNIKIRLDHTKADEKKPDFIGRQIDIGFRIAKYSTLNRFVISVEFAIILLRDNYLTIEDEGIKLYYEGRKPIKGILEHLGYPIVYIDMEDKFKHSENDLLFKDVRPANQINLMRFMEEYIKRTNFILYYPFVHDNDKLFKDTP